MIIIQPGVDPELVDAIAFNMYQKQQWGGYPADTLRQEFLRRTQWNCLPDFDNAKSYYDDATVVSGKDHYRILAQIALVTIMEREKHGVKI